MRGLPVWMLSVAVLGTSGAGEEASADEADTTALPMDNIAGMDHGQMRMSVAEAGQHDRAAGG